MTGHVSHDRGFDFERNLIFRINLMYSRVLDKLDVFVIFLTFMRLLTFWAGDLISRAHIDEPGLAVKEGKVQGLVRVHGALKLQPWQWLLDSVEESVGTRCLSIDY